MMTSYTYKRQGDGRDSWVREVRDDKNILIIVDMVYEDPAAPRKIDLANIDLTTLTQAQIDQLKQLLNG